MGGKAGPPADHADVSTSLNNMAELYRNQDRYAEAEPLHERAYCWSDLHKLPRC